MPALTFSDLSQMFQLRRNTVRVRNDLTRASQELSSGKHADLGKAVSGNFAPLAAIDKQLSVMSAYKTNANEAALFFDTAQAALDRVKTLSSDFGLRLADAWETDIMTVGSVFASEARSAFDLSVSSLNSRAAGRAIFAGAATDGLAVSEDILTTLEGLVGTMTTAQDVIDEVDNWFNTNFATDGYVGSANQISNFHVADGRQLEMTLKADHPAIREQLRGLALAAMLDHTAITAPDELTRLANVSGTALMANQSNMISLQAGIGSAQERVDIARSQNAAETTALGIARSGIVAVDPFEVATELQNLQTQLETIYTITARLSGLSLTNYLR